MGALSKGIKVHLSFITSLMISAFLSVQEVRGNAERVLVVAATAECKLPMLYYVTDN